MNINRKLSRRLMIFALIILTVSIITGVYFSSGEKEVKWVPEGEPDDRYIRLLGRMAETWDGFNPALPPEFNQPAIAPAQANDTNEIDTQTKKGI